MMVVVFYFGSLVSERCAQKVNGRLLDFVVHIGSGQATCRLKRRDFTFVCMQFNFHLFQFQFEYRGPGNFQSTEVFGWM